MKATLYNDCDVKLSLNPAARTDGTANGTSADRHTDSQAYRSALVIIHAGAITDGTHTFEVQDSANDTDFTAVAAEFLQGTEPALGEDDDNEVHVIGYTGNRRYLRVVCVTSGATSGGIASAVIVLGGGRRKVVRA